MNPRTDNNIHRFSLPCNDPVRSEYQFLKLPRCGATVQVLAGQYRKVRPLGQPMRDRKSTRLNSSHVSISYAVFCLKNNIDTSYRPMKDEARLAYKTSS